LSPMIGFSFMLFTDFILQRFYFCALKRALKCALPDACLRQE